MIKQLTMRVAILDLQNNFFEIISLPRIKTLLESALLRVYLELAFILLFKLLFLNDFCS